MKYTNWGRTLSEHFPIRDAITTDRDWRVVTQQLSVGQTVTGLVIAKSPFGAWVDIGVEFPALLEIICMEGMTAEVYHSDAWCPIGSELTAFVGGFGDANHQVHLWQVQPLGDDDNNSDRAFIGGNRNPLKYGLSLRASSGDRPDPKIILLAADILGRDPFYIDSNIFECEMIAATVHPDGTRLVYVESRAKEMGQFVDITIKIHFRDANEAISSVDIESYNPFFGCDVGFLNWVNDDVALLIYSEKHWTFAYRIGDQWPPEFTKIDERWQLRGDVLSYMEYKAQFVKRIAIPSLTPMADISVSEAERLGVLPPDPYSD